MEGDKFILFSKFGPSLCCVIKAAMVINDFNDAGLLACLCQQEGFDFTKDIFDPLQNTINLMLKKKKNLGLIFNEKEIADIKLSLEDIENSFEHSRFVFTFAQKYKIEACIKAIISDYTKASTLDWLKQGWKLHLKKEVLDVEKAMKIKLMNQHDEVVIDIEGRNIWAHCPFPNCDDEIKISTDKLRIDHPDYPRVTYRRFQTHLRLKKNSHKI